MKRASEIFLVILAALHLCGGHLGLMRMAAWAQMIRDYSAEKGLVEGIKNTFDGEHPCDMCRKIAVEERRDQREPQMPWQTLEKISKWFGALADSEMLPPFLEMRNNSLAFVDPARNAERRNGSPPTPPPRWLA